MSGTVKTRFVATAPRCTCTHERDWHYDRGKGRCDVDGCRCTRFTWPTAPGSQPVEAPGAP